VAAAATLAVSLHAAAPTFWQVSTQSDLLRGEVTNLSIDQHGRLILGPATVQHYEAPRRFSGRSCRRPMARCSSAAATKAKCSVWTTRARDRCSSTRLSSRCTRSPTGLPASHVGTSPDGKIYKVAPDGKSSSVFFDPEDKYIWAIAVDPAGTVYAAAGEKGIVYRISPDGKGAPLYKTNTTHVVSLAFDKAGNLLAGTEAPGKLFRFDKDGKPFVMLDSTFTEIHAIRVDPKGTIYATAVSGRPALGDDRPTIDRPITEPSRGGGPPVPTVTTEITSMALADVSLPGGPQSGVTPREDRRSPKGAVYRVNPDGPWDIVWESRDDSHATWRSTPTGRC
jgi:WD40 repeat protein